MTARADEDGAAHRLVPGPAPGEHPGDRPPGADVVIDSVSKTFRRSGRRTVALSGVNLEVGAGELVCLLGPSGCGKSTLLRIVAGALERDEGTVTVAAGALAGTT